MSYYNARRDSTHKVVAEELQRQGWRLKDTAGAKGFVDLVVFHPWLPARGVVLVEVKRPDRVKARSRYTKAQLTMEAEGWPVVVLTDAAHAARWSLEQVEQFRGAGR